MYTSYVCPCATTTLPAGAKTTNEMTMGQQMNYGRHFLLQLQMQITLDVTHHQSKSRKSFMRPSSILHRCWTTRTSLPPITYHHSIHSTNNCFTCQISRSTMSCESQFPPSSAVSCMNRTLHWVRRRAPLQRLTIKLQDNSYWHQIIPLHYTQHVGLTPAGTLYDFAFSSPGHRKHLSRIARVRTHALFQQKKTTYFRVLGSCASSEGLHGYTPPVRPSAHV